MTFVNYFAYDTTQQITKLLFSYNLRLVCEACLTPPNLMTKNPNEAAVMNIITHLVLHSEIYGLASSHLSRV